MIKIKRIYENPVASDGYRVLVDRLWPRGVSKEKAALDDWLKDAAPSSALRVWFNHEPERFEEFKHRYVEELDDNTEIQKILQKTARAHKTMTLVYAARDPQINHARVLKEYIEKLTK